MTRAGAGALVAIALTTGLALRLARLDVRPMHHDEANQAVKFGALLERGEYAYDARDHHGPTPQWVQVDLGASRALHAILVWHYHSQARVYHDVVAQVSDDPAFKTGVTTVYNNDHDNSAKLGAGADKEYIEVAEGRLIDAKGTKGRFVRLYSNGNTTNDLSHYVEVEVYGSPK